jgi:D-alanyl-D-alanine carboxypeptidase
VIERIRKLSVFLFSAALILSLCGCSRTGVIIEYGSSEIFSEAEIEAAIHAIEENSEQWGEFVFTAFRYGGDESSSEENLNALNSLSDWDNTYEQCILFRADFHTLDSVREPWEANHEYLNYQFWLARDIIGSWQLVSYGPE